MISCLGALALVGFLESSSAAQIFALKNNYKIDINQELVAIVTASFPFSSSPSVFRVWRTLLARSSNACLSWVRSLLKSPNSLVLYRFGWHVSDDLDIWRKNWHGG